MGLSLKDAKLLRGRVEAAEGLRGEFLGLGVIDTREALAERAIKAFSVALETALDQLQEVSRLLTEEMDKTERLEKGLEKGVIAAVGAAMVAATGDLLRWAGLSGRMRRPQGGRAKRTMVRLASYVWGRYGARFRW